MQKKSSNSYEEIGLFVACQNAPDHGVAFCMRGSPELGTFEQSKSIRHLAYFRRQALLVCASLCHPTSHEKRLIVVLNCNPFVVL
jgi:hypothetical protein